MYPPNANTPLSPHERVQRAMNAMEQPHVCDRCGSTHFAAVSYFQYAVGHYSSAPGGDLHQIGDMPQTILVCICGEPKSPNIGGVRGGRTATAEIGSFLDSLHKAQAYRGSAAERFDTEVERIVAQAVAGSQQDIVLQRDFNAFREQVEATLTNPLLQRDAAGNVSVVTPPAEPPAIVTTGNIAEAAVEASPANGKAAAKGKK